MFPDGKTLPVVSGGSDEGLVVPTLNLPGNSEPSVSSDPPIQEFSEFAQGILNKIPEQDRNIVGKYIKEWDGNVTKQFQKIHSEYEPYKTLGSVDDLQQSMSYIQMLNEDPVGFIAQVQEALKEMGLMEPEYEETDVDSEIPADFEGIDPKFVQKFMQMEQQLNGVSEFLTAQTAAQEQQEQMAQLDNLFEDLHNTHGDFSEDFVLVQLSKGSSPEEAIEAWGKELEKYGSPKRPAPNLFRGGAGVPGGQVVPSKLSRADAKAYAVQQLLAAQD